MSRVAYRHRPLCDGTHAAAGRLQRSRGRRHDSVHRRERASIGHQGDARNRLERHPEFLPEDVGVTDDCTRPVHTVDNSSYVYIVGDGKYTVGDFFEVWEDSPDTRPGAIVENISLNGQAFNGDYRAIVFEDDQRIVVAFGDRTP